MNPRLQQILASLPPGLPAAHRSLIQQRFDPSYLPDTPVIPPLWNLCDWERTPEGGDFWEALNAHLEGEARLPELPTTTPTTDDEFIL